MAAVNRLQYYLEAASSQPPAFSDDVLIASGLVVVPPPITEQIPPNDPREADMYDRLCGIVYEVNPSCVNCPRISTALSRMTDKILGDSDYTLEQAQTALYEQVPPDCRGWVLRSIVDASPVKDMSGPGLVGVSCPESVAIRL